MNENEETKPQETEQQAAPTEPPEETVGDIMQKMSGEGLKWLVIIGGALVYLTAVIYAEVHGLTALQKGVTADMRIWAAAGMVAAGVSAVLFPIALKVWAIEAKHRLAAIIFYVLDFGFLMFNSFTDFNIQQIHTMAPWAQSYVTYVLPASPVIVGAMWAILFQLDPDVRQKILQLTLRAAMKEKLARKVADAAKGAKVTSRVTAAAEEEVERALTELFGHPVRSVTGYAMDTTDRTRDSLAARFFDWASRLGQSLASSGMPSPSNPSPSEESSLIETQGLEMRDGSPRTTNEKPEPMGSTRPLYNERSYHPTPKPDEPEE
jgi:hypothetical protein